ncbi:hypothetical protein WICPIJ_000106 [Wickerhamomyces pijperi]|uniref:Uncharacterized protein n=1 Tax=Wickerhamomyces pijperi TaxID=599730 RepID=A0A9P8QEJ3_WICPI|nr:hypothetical protein WICPIJ_000106 [Wickerhamomyces pijperi]
MTGLKTTSFGVSLNLTNFQSNLTFFGMDPTLDFKDFSTQTETDFLIGLTSPAAKALLTLTREWGWKFVVGDWNIDISCKTDETRVENVLLWGTVSLVLVGIGGVESEEAVAGGSGVQADKRSRAGPQYQSVR